VRQWWGALALCALAAAAQAADVVREVSWSSVKQGGASLPGQVRPADASAGFEYLVVTHPEAQARTFPLLRLDRPGVTKARYALAGEVRYEGVEGTGYLEMWSGFGAKGRFFSRTLAPSGPSQGFSGSSPWRPFVLPFDATGAEAPLESLTVNLALPGRGTVHLGRLRLLQYDAGEDAMAGGGAWWGPRAAGLAGGIAGSVIGCAGALIGLLASRGKGRAIVLGLAKGMLVFGAAALALAVVALLRAQPYEVVYPLVLEGILCLVLPAYLIPVLRRRYDEVELRKMEARDLSARHPA
jgi:hypothetical protein